MMEIEYTYISNENHITYEVYVDDETLRLITFENNFWLFNKITYIYTQKQIKMLNKQVHTINFNGCDWQATERMCKFVRV